MNSLDHYADPEGKLDELITQRDELLAALKRAYYHLEGQEYLDAMAVIRTAITKTKGGSR